jgi:hypothetical protein
VIGTGTTEQEILNNLNSQIYDDTQLPIFLEASAYEMGQMYAFDGQVGQNKITANFAYDVNCDVVTVYNTTNYGSLSVLADAEFTIHWGDGTSNTITFASTGGSGSFSGGSVAGTTQFTNTAVSTSNTTGAVTISGGLGVSGNVYTGSHVITGNSANGLTFTDNTILTTAYAMSIVASQGWFLP